MNKRRPTEDECEKVLKMLVQTDTCQPEGREVLLARKILQWLKSIRGYTKERVEETFLLHSGDRASLIVKLKGSREEGGIALIGHLDTVACSDIAAWEYEPHQAVVKDGILYGRGSCDMKGGVASMMLTLRFLLEQAVIPKKPVFFCFTADEEKNGTGAVALADHPWLGGIEEAIICEPSNGEVGCCEKGALWMRVEMTGRTAHASRPELGVNAIEAAIAFRERFQKETVREERHEMLGAATMSVTVFSGGIMTNMIPDRAKMELDIRTLPGMSHDALKKRACALAGRMEEENQDLTCRISFINDRPALETKPEHPFVQDIREAAKRAGQSGKPRGIIFYTDASQLIPKWDVPFVIVGPGDDRLAHCVNEYIPLKDVAQVTELYLTYLLDYF